MAIPNLSNFADLWIKFISQSEPSGFQTDSANVRVTPLKTKLCQLTTFT